MLLFIALPIISIVTQSFYTPHDAVLIETKNCDPFGCKVETSIDQNATAELRSSKPLGKFVGFDIFLDRSHLATSEIASAWKKSNSMSTFFDSVQNLPFYRAISFTLTYTFSVTDLFSDAAAIVKLSVGILARFE